jgi:CHAT domain-containing protein
MTLGGLGVLRWSASVIHLAAHGLLPEDRPNHSGLSLSFDGDPAEDGLLQVFEIFRLRLQADLVVLSACDSGRGKHLRGEGVLGLTRAFLYAGASSLVVSLWQAADSPTADLMLSFHRKLRGGRSKADALRSAKLEAIQSGVHAHPFYWAPFVLMGAE